MTEEHKTIQETAIATQDVAKVTIQAIGAKKPYIMKTLCLKDSLTYRGDYP